MEDIDIERMIREDRENANKRNSTAIRNEVFARHDVDDVDVKPVAKPEPSVESDAEDLSESVEQTEFDSVGDEAVQRELETQSGNNNYVAVSDDTDDVADNDVEQSETEAPVERRLPDFQDDSSDDDIDMDVEMQPGGGTHTASNVVRSVKQVDKTPPKRDVDKKRALSYPRYIPTVYANEARRLFPNAENVTDALVAYMAIKSGITADLSDKQLELVRDFDGDDPMVSVNDRLTRLENKMNALVAMHNEMELAVAYVLFDRLGFRRETPGNPGNTNLLENGVDELVERMRQCAKQFVDYDRRKHGRPNRQRK